MSVQYTSFSDTGRARATNQDAWLADLDLGLFVVCDGMGGRPGGEVAAHVAARAVRQSLQPARAMLEAVAREREPIDEAARLLVAAIRAASRRIWQLSRLDVTHRQMGTTCTALLVCGRHAVLAHVGDSRLYLIGSGVVSQLTDDHTLARELGRAGRPHVLGPGTQNVLVRWVGPAEPISVDTLAFDVTPGDTLVLCSDGLTRHIADRLEIAEIVGSAEQDPARALVDVANERGGRDNITAIVVRVDDEPIERDERTTRPHPIVRDVVGGASPRGRGPGL